VSGAGFSYVIPAKTQYTIVIPAKAGIQVNVYFLLIPSCPGFYFGAGLNMPTKIIKITTFL
jgi:hypothetical protein